MEIKSKPWYESVTVWGNVVTVIATVTGLFGMTIGPDAQQQAIDIVPKVVHALGQRDWVTAIGGVVAFVGVVMSLFGRNQAVQPVHFVKPFTVSPEGIKP